MEQIRKVYVVHKTHLDIGFTDFSQKVLDHYVRDFIPKAIETANEVNVPGKPKQFVWTVGAFLIKYYLEHTDAEGKEKIERAIEEGYVDWHLLPLTTHTELMDADLFCYGLNIGKELDQTYKKNHFAGKMTDVPGHTHAMVPYLVQNGITYLHIGINAASRAVKVPSLCKLKYGEYEIILNYAQDYGEACIFKDVALEFAHTADNVGPPNTASIKKEMERLARQYPNAEIISSGLEGFAAMVTAFSEELPIITQELGDTWIHGIAADPFKTAAFCELKKIRRRWLEEDPQAVRSKEYDRFMEKLLLVSEHTWGMDYKLYLHDSHNWDKSNFREVRKNKKTYSEIELSWKEQRGYLDKAIQELPEALKKDMAAIIKTLLPQESDFTVRESLKRDFIVNGWNVTVAEDGSLAVWEKDGGRYTNTRIGILSYEAYNSETVYKCYREYNRNFETEGNWAEPDFAKPGLSEAGTAKNGSYSYKASGTERKGNKISVALTGENEAYTQFGCPKKAVIEYTLLDKSIQVKVSWFEKAANRMPEAAYFGFMFDSYEELTVWKLGLSVNPLSVADGGNKKMHAVEKVSGGHFEVIPQHSPLLSVGGKNLYETGDAYGDLSEGLHFMLHNNRWNTNFPLWYEQNASFTFTVSLQGNKEGGRK